MCDLERFPKIGSQILLLLSILICSIKNKVKTILFSLTGDLLGDLAESLGYIETVVTHFNNISKATTRTLTFETQHPVSGILPFYTMSCCSDVEVEF